MLPVMLSDPSGEENSARQDPRLLRSQPGPSLATKLASVSRSRNRQHPRSALPKWNSSPPVPRAGSSRYVFNPTR